MNTVPPDITNGIASTSGTFEFPSHASVTCRVVATEIRYGNVNYKHTDSLGSNENATKSDSPKNTDRCHADMTKEDHLCSDTGSGSDISRCASACIIERDRIADFEPGHDNDTHVRDEVAFAGRSNDGMEKATTGSGDPDDVDSRAAESHLRTMDRYADCPCKTNENRVPEEICHKSSTIQVNEGAVFSTFTGIQSVLGSHLDPKQGCRQAERVEVEGKKTDARQETERWKANEREEEIIKERERKREQERGRRQKREAENQWRLTFDRLHPNKRPAAVLHAAVPAPCLHLHPPLLLPPPLPSSSSASSSSFSFHRTIIRHHLALPPPPPPPPQPHLPLTPYPHLLPSFPHHPHHHHPHHHHHLSPMPLSPPPALPTFYPSSAVHHLLEHPGVFPLATTFHPMTGHHSPLYTQTHAAVMPLQVLF
ncbi:unnamed protein product [Merluccius merluccius]